jgi:FemAB-related protein (PEP-CTERM system-associated)
MVRQGIKAELSAEIDPDVSRFYDIYATSVRNLGTPVFSRKYFEISKEVFGQSCQVLTVVRDNRPISSVLSFFFRDEVLPYYGGSVPEARQVAGNDFMYWELMRRACEQGIRVFDYGRSKRGTGSFDFKKNWGFEPQPLKYQYLLVKAKTMPDVSPLNPRYRLFIDLWKHMPLTLSKLMGPMIAKNLG